MLVLTRKIGEKILVPHCQLSVTVLEITPSRVRLGVSAPAQIAVHREEAVKRIARRDPVSIGETLMSAHVLIADPDRFLSASYSRHLNEHGATVTTATTGLECAERLREAQPDVLILKTNLLWGGADGILALFDEKPELRPRVVMLLVQGWERSLLYRLSSFKVDDYQMKPITASSLAERMCMLLSPTCEPALSPR